MSTQGDSADILGFYFQMGAITMQSMRKEDYFQNDCNAKYS